MTGVLPIALGRATRVTEVMLKSGKQYVALMHLHKEVSEKDLRDAFKKFTGKIRQLPPIKSAVKRQLRTRSIYKIDILEIDGKDVLFLIDCQSGTYIRKYIHDIGQHLKVGAHMNELRRTRASCFGEDTLIKLQDLVDAYHFYRSGNSKFLQKIIMPIESAVGDMPKVWILDSAVEPLCHGQNLKLPGISKFESGISRNDNVAIMTLKDELVGLGVAVLGSREMLEDKGVAVKINRVYMKVGTY